MPLFTSDGLGLGLKNLVLFTLHHWSTVITCVKWITDCGCVALGEDTHRTECCSSCEINKLQIDDVSVSNQIAIDYVGYLRNGFVKQKLNELI